MYSYGFYIKIIKIEQFIFIINVLRLILHPFYSFYAGYNHKKYFFRVYTMNSKSFFGHVKVLSSTSRTQHIDTRCVLFCFNSLLCRYRVKLMNTDVKRLCFLDISKKILDIDQNLVQF